MKTFQHYITAVFFITGILLAMPAVAEQADGHIDGNHFRLYYKSTVNPLPLFRIHGWVLHVDTLDGQPVNDARVIVYGGMPAHRHGLPTKPVVVETGDGHYFLKGLKFSMTGHWEVWFDIKANGKAEKFKVDLNL